jgi:SSS family solute:Na+ symporter
MDRMLHRGKYAMDKQQADGGKGTGNLLTRLIGIDSNYTRGDKALAWSAFIYSFGWCFCLCFVANVVWHVLGVKGILPPQPDSWWSVYFFIVNFVVACAIGVVSTFWFGICGTRDLMRLFRDLDARERAGGGQNALDDGRVEGHVSLADAAEINGVEDSRN